MKLHAYFRSSTSYRLRIALNLKGLGYEVVPVNIVKGEQKEPKFLSHNPFAGVPLLEADGRDRAQSMAILEWLDEAYPERPLLPASVEDRFTARELAYAIATDIHAVNNLSVMKYLKNELGHEQAAIDTWYRHWLAKTLVPVEARLAQRANEALHSAPGMFGNRFLFRRCITLDVSHSIQARCAHRTDRGGLPRPSAIPARPSRQPAGHPQGGSGPMKLASLKHGRDGKLVVVSKDITRYSSAERIAPTMQYGARQLGPKSRPQLEALRRDVEHGTVPATASTSARPQAPCPAPTNGPTARPM